MLFNNYLHQLIYRFRPGSVKIEFTIRFVKVITVEVQPDGTPPTTQAPVLDNDIEAIGINIEDVRQVIQDREFVIKISGEYSSHFLRSP